MLRSGTLPTIKSLIERYVHRIVIHGENIEVQFNLNLSSRVVNYPADFIAKKEISQPAYQDMTEIISFVPTKMLATNGGAGGN